jgi:hypothetical protein
MALHQATALRTCSSVACCEAFVCSACDPHASVQVHAATGLSLPAFSMRSSIPLAHHQQLLPGYGAMPGAGLPGAVTQLPPAAVVQQPSHYWAGCYPSSTPQLSQQQAPAAYQATGGAHPYQPRPSHYPAPLGYQAAPLSPQLMCLPQVVPPAATHALVWQQLQPQYAGAASSVPSPPPHPGCYSYAPVRHT